MSQPTARSNARLWAAIVTAICAAGLGALLMWLHLSVAADRTWPPEPDPYIELAAVEEFIEPEPVPLPKNAPELLDAPAQLPENNMQDSKPAPQSGTVLENRGSKAEPAKPVATPKPSPVKTVETPKPTKTGAAVDNAKKEQDAAAKRTNSQVANAFGGKNNANTGAGDVGKSGRTDGNPASGGPATSTSKSVGISKGRLGGGWQWPDYASFKNPTANTGTIVVELVIDRNGVPTVKSISGTPPIYPNPQIEKRCRDIATSRKFASTFTDASRIPEQTTAKLTFKFE